MHRNAVNPGLQAGLAVEVFHSSEDFQEDFLCGIGGISRIGDDAVYQAVNGLVKLADQPGVGVLGAGLEFGNDRRFLAPDCYRACKIAQGGCPRHNSHGVTPYYSFFPDPKPARKVAFVVHSEAPPTLIRPHGIILSSRTWNSSVFTGLRRV